MLCGKAKRKLSAGNHKRCGSACSRCPKDVYCVVFSGGEDRNRSDEAWMSNTWSSWMLGVTSSCALRLLGRLTPPTRSRRACCHSAHCCAAGHGAHPSFSGAASSFKPRPLARGRLRSARCRCSKVEVFTRSVPWCFPGLLPGCPGRGPIFPSLSLSLSLSLCLSLSRSLINSPFSLPLCSCRGRGILISDRPRRFGSYACVQQIFLGHGVFSYEIFSCQPAFQLSKSSVLHSPYLALPCPVQTQKAWAVVERQTGLARQSPPELRSSFVSKPVQRGHTQKPKTKQLYKHANQGQRQRHIRIDECLYIFIQTHTHTQAHNHKHHKADLVRRSAGGHKFCSSAVCGAFEKL